MPTKREREYYGMWFRDGYSSGLRDQRRGFGADYGQDESMLAETIQLLGQPKRKPVRQLSAWNKYIKNKRNHIKYRDGKLNLKKMAVAFRRKRRR